MNNFCSNCGNPIENGNNFCSNCGKYVDTNNFNVENNIEDNNYEMNKDSNSLKTVSLVMGIISIVLCIFLNVLIIPVAIIGLIIGIVYTVKSKKFCAGIVLNALGIVIPILLLVFVISALISVNSSIKDIWKNDYELDFDNNYYNDDTSEDNYYGEDTFENKDNYESEETIQNNYFKKIELNDVIDLINNKEDFVIVISQTTCGACTRYKPKVENVAKKNKLTIYYIEYNLLFDSEKKTLLNYIPFSGTPNTAFFKDGKELTNLRIVGNIVEEDEFEKILRDNNYI